MNVFTSSNTKYKNSTLYEINESYKELRTNLMLTLDRDKCKTIVITSPLQSEGKSTTSVNLAISLARANKNVLIIDADLRNPNVYHFFDLSNSEGLSDFLNGTVDLCGIIKDSSVERLKVITSGTSIANSAESFSNPQMFKLWNKLTECFDYIIIDSPPLGLYLDSIPFIKLASGVILVVRENYSEHSTLQKTIKQIELIDGNILGFVLNYTNQSDSGHTYNYKYANNKRFKKIRYKKR